MALDNIQKKLTRVRPPRVKITYDLETEGAIITKELPCIVGIIADLTGYRDENDPIEEYNNRKFIFVDPENFNDVIKSSKAKALITIGLGDNKEAFLVQFEDIEHFHPLYLIEKIPILKERFSARTQLSDLKTRLSNSGKLHNCMTAFLKDKTVNKNEIFKNFNFFSETQKQYLYSLFDLMGTIDQTGDNPILSIQKHINSVDNELNDLLNQALHDKSYKHVESTWLGIKYFIKNTELSERLKLRILNANYRELDDDLNKALEFDQSFLFQQLYEKEYGTYGGNPYSTLIVDWALEKNEESFNFLGKLSEVCSAAHLPTSVGVKSSFFDLDSYQDLHKPRMISKIFDSPEYATFKNLREKDESRYISIILPSFMSRVPYGKKTKEVEGMNFEEDVSSHDKFCWSNASYIYGTNIAQSFALYSWFSAIIGPENGGMISNLPVYVYKDRDGDLMMKCPTETTITDRREKELSDLGFISICHCKDTNYSVFFSGQSLNKPMVFDKSAATANAKLSARFQYILNCSRFAHYIKCIMRDKIGSFATPEIIKGFLTKWIMQYVLDMDEASQQIKAELPLREASLEVQEIAGSPGVYDCVIYLRPHFQMEELTVSLRLVAKIPVKE